MRAYLDFLAQLPGQPEWVVTDRDRGLDNAIDEAWPQAIRYYSHWHLRENAKAALKTDKGLCKTTREDLERESEFALGSLKSYDRALDAARQAGAAALESWLLTNRAFHRSQLRKQIGHIGYPKGTGTVEGDYIPTVKAAIGSRKQSFTNVDRLNKLLAFIRAEADHVASVETYSALIRSWLRSREGRVEIPWKEAMDSWGCVRSTLRLPRRCDAVRPFRPSARDHQPAATARRPMMPSERLSGWRRGREDCRVR